LHPLLDHSHCADHFEGRKAKVTRPEMADNVDNNRVLDRYGRLMLPLIRSTKHSIAVIIGCCPMLAALIPKSNPSQRVSYDTHGYVRQSASRSNGSANEGVVLGSVKSSTKSRKKPSSEMYWSDGHGSQEELPQLPATKSADARIAEGEEPKEPNDERRRDPRNVRQLMRMR
jgi:hypothetical protein